MGELFELKLGNLTMDAYEKKFLELLTYANYIKDMKGKIQIFLSGITGIRFSMICSRPLKSN